MGNVSVRPAVQRQSLIPKYGLQIGERGDRWEEEFIKNIDFSTMDNGEDWSSLFSYSKAKDFDLTALDSKNVTNMSAMFDGVNGDVLHLAGLIVGPETLGNYMFRGTFNDIDFTGAKFYHIPFEMLNGIKLKNALKMNTLNTTHLTSLDGLFSGVTLPTLDLTGFNTSHIVDMDQLFSGAEISEIIGLKELDYSNVTTAYSMFQGYRGFEIDLSGIKFLSLTDATNMFNNAGYYASQHGGHLTLNISNTYFPVIESAYYMFALYGIADLITEGAIFKSIGLNAAGMFNNLNLIDNKGLDLNFLKGAKIDRFGSMFYGTKLGETDFTPLDFSIANDAWGYPFSACETPIVHLKTPITLKSQTIGYLMYNHKVENIILELETPPNVTNVRYLIQPYDYNNVDYGKSIIIRNSEFYATDYYYFLYGCFNVTIEDTVFHIGDGARFEYVICNYGSGRKTYLNMRTAVFDGTILNSSYMFGSGSGNWTEIIFPETGMKFKGTLSYTIYGYSEYDSTTNTSTYYGPRVENMDKFDVSEVSELRYIIRYCGHSFDLSGWDVSNATTINYVFDTIRGDINLNGWDVHNATNIVIGSNVVGNVDVRNWDVSGATSIAGVYTFLGGSIDFDGWNIPKDKNLTNCYLIGGSNYTEGKDGIVYIPSTIYAPNSYPYTMFGCGSPTQYQQRIMIIDVYTDATSIEEQGWIFEHMYSAEEPWGYRIHWGSTHDEFLEAVREQNEQEGGD